MNSDTIVRVTSEGLMLCLWVSLPATVVAAVVGLMISFVQAITSIQEQSVSQFAKLATVIATLVIAAPWGGAMVLRYAQLLFGMAMAV
jgi:type III secretion protein S